MRVKYIVLILAGVVLALLGGNVLAATTSVNVNDATGSPESEVGVSIHVAGAADIGSMDIVLSYDAAVLSAGSVEKGELTSNSLLDSNTATPGIVAIAIADTDGLNGNGSVAIITFNVVGQSGATSPLTLEDVKASDVNTFTDILITAESGTFTVTEKGLSLSPTIISIIVVVIIVIVVGVIFAVRRRKKAA